MIFYELYRRISYLYDLKFSSYSSVILLQQYFTFLMLCSLSFYLKLSGGEGRKLVEQQYKKF